MSRILRAVALAVLASACGGESPSGGAPSTSGAMAPATPDAVDIRLTTPIEARVGDNSFEVLVTRDAQPVTDADVTVDLVMPAMPSMNMPEMRVQVPTTHAGEGRYRGTGSLGMGGAWDVNVMVMRGAEHLGQRTITVVAK